VKTRPRGRAIVRGGTGTATRTMAFLSSVFTYAVGEGYLPTNPAKGIALPGYSSRKARLDADGYRKLELTLEEALRRQEPHGRTCWRSGQ
jgi:hypothetical protein